MSGHIQVKAWPAPGKLNLFLHITGRRHDGYHLLQTVFQFINHCDWLTFTLRYDGIIQSTATSNHAVAPEHDLTVRAARLLQCHVASSHGVDIHLDKRLPMGGGLGGGSSDAATTLVALNQLWGLHLPLEQLAVLGLQLGADVPVFIHGQAAWAEGVGEVMTPVTLPEPWYLVMVPPCHVSTAEIFSAPELTRDAPALTIEGFLSVLEMASGDFAWGGSNVCEPVVCWRYPPVAEALAWLRGYADTAGARMTGTGACVFAAFADESAAHRAMRQMPAAMQGFVAQGMNRSPLYALDRDES